MQANQERGRHKAEIDKKIYPYPAFTDIQAGFEDTLFHVGCILEYDVIQSVPFTARPLSVPFGTASSLYSSSNIACSSPSTCLVNSSCSMLAEEKGGKHRNGYRVMDEAGGS